MFHHARNRFVCFTLFGPCLLWAALFYGRDWHMGAQSKLPAGRYTAEQIAQRSEPLCALFKSAAEQLTMTSYSVEIFSSIGTVCHVWEVDVMAPSRGILAHLIWDADTGELRSVTLEPQPCERKEFRIDSPEAAFRVAWDWMTALGFARNVHDWKLDGRPERDAGVWVVHWRGGSRKILIKLEAESSRLIHAYSYQTETPQ